MSKLKNKWVILTIVILIIVLVIFIKNKEEKVNYITELSKITNLSETVEVTGSIESADDIDLNFSMTGTLYNVLVNVGDEVYVNQRLAYLSAGSKSALVESARAGVSIAESRLDALLAGASNQDVNVVKEEVESAEISYNTALNSLMNLKSTRDQELNSLNHSGLNSLDDKYFIGQYALDIVYDAIIDQDAGNYLYVSNSSLFNQAKSKYHIAKNSYQDVVTYINIANETEEDLDVITALDEMEKVLEDISTSLTYAFDTMLVTITNSEYTETIINNFKTSINAQMTTVNTGVSNISTASSELSSKILYYENAIIEAEDAISLALSNLNLTKAKLELKKTPARDFEIAEAEADIRSANATLNRYLSDLSETVIKAPVAGIITEVNFDKGEQTSLSKPVISMIGLSNMQIEVDVPESDITKLKVNDEVDITLDAFSSEDLFRGTITFIDPAATVINEVIYYKVKVSFNELDERIKAGMTADLIISTNSKDNILVVPSRSIIHREGSKYIQVLENGSLKEKPVVTGLKGDDGLVEIISGIEENEEVITFIKNN